jgi:hypothetical protein
MAASWLYGDYLDDGKGGLKAWFGEAPNTTLMVLPRKTIV